LHRKPSGYDDELMAWSRSLGPASEQLRDDTFPFVEHLKKYPPPVGLQADPPLVTAADVETQTLSLRRNFVTLLATNPNSPEGAQSARTLVEAINSDVDRIWASGRSVEWIQSLHANYDKFLQTYEGAVQSVAASASRGATGERIALATGLNLLVGALVLMGLVALFWPARAKAPIGRES
jgi:hypothetical protein